MADINPTPKKRRRPALACVECRRRKVKCDRNLPCRRCVQNSADCTYVENNQAPKNSRVSRRRLVENADEAEAPVAATLCQSVDRSPLHNSFQSLPTRNVESIAEGRSPHEPSPDAGRSELFLQGSAVRPRERPKRSKTSRSSSHDAGLNSSIHGTLSKTRVFGPSHWMSAYPGAVRLPALNMLGSLGFVPSQQTNTELYREVKQTVKKCKQLARTAKTQRPSRSPLPAGMLQSFPSPPVMENLVELYFRTFESCYRMLHSPSFYTEFKSYVRNLEGATTSFVLKLSLVMSIVAPMVDDAALREILRKSARDWIDIAHSWISGPVEKDRLTIDGLQIHCLLLLARQVNYVGADLVWISAGTLMRMAMQMGFHRDPSHLREMSILERELRRRLWFTIVEINVDGALDAGMVPMVPLDSYDTQIPSNIDDDDLCDIAGTESMEKAPNILTRVSFQRLLASSLPLRLKVASIMNDLQKEPSYDEVLRLGSEMMSAHRNFTETINRYRSLDSNWWLSEFPYNICDHYHRRFLLLLHRPFLIKSYEDPRYSYSAKICLENALSTISLLDDEIYNRLMVVGGGMFREILTDSALVIFLELSTQLGSDNAVFSRTRNKAQREPLIEDARKVVQHGRERLLQGETNVKIYVYFKIVMAQIDAMIEGSSIGDAVKKSAIDSLRVCYDILKARAEQSSPMTNTLLDMECQTSESAILTPSAGAMEFDFLTGLDMDFDQLSSSFIQQWQEQTEF